MAQIRKRNGRWHYRVWVKGKCYSGPTDSAAVEREKSAAMRFAERRKVEIRAELETPLPASKPFSQAVDEFLEWCFASEYRRKPNTARRIKTSFASLLEFFEGKSVQAITAGDIERFKVWRGGEHQVRDVTIRHDLHALSVFFGRYATKFGWRTDNPVDKVSKPSDLDAVRIHVLTDEEEAAYFAAAWANKNLYDLARLMILQGCRPEELLALKQVDVDIAGKVIHIRGGKSRAAKRTLDLTGESIEILTRRLSTAGKWVFPSPRRPGEHLVKLNGPHDHACIEAGVSFVLYDLRHTFATRLAAAGVPITTIAAILGHSGLRMVMRYVHPEADSKRQAMRDYERTIKPRLKVVG